jgi:transcriptional regulator with XRE-family HTH domain
MWRKEDVVEQLRKEQGERSLREYASAIGVSAANISLVYTGKREPSKKLLDHLDLERKEIKTFTYQKRRWK